MSDSYRGAGVDIEAAAEAVALIADLAATAQRPEVTEGIGGFAGLFRISESQLLAAATDGVGTKLEVARMLERLDTVGVDLVAMCADDVVCTGAEPLLFLDYLAVGSVAPERVAAIVGGIAEGCRRAGCALLGGETAEHPGVMADDAFDLGGFCVGVVDEADLLGPHRVQEGDVLIGLASSGLHANGYSLVRATLLPRYGLSDHVEVLGRSLGEELLEPCTIHTPDVLALHHDGLLHAAAHVTGGGITGNLPRALPALLSARIERGTWYEPPIFGLIQETAGIPDDDMFATFNMGLGMILVVDPEHAGDVLARTQGRGVRVGTVVPAGVPAD